MLNTREQMNSPTDINDCQPTSLSHLIGQRKVVEQIEVALDAAQQDTKKFDHALMVGPPGLGKSALANVVANEMATGFHEVIGQCHAVQLQDLPKRNSDSRLP